MQFNKKTVAVVNGEQVIDAIVEPGTTARDVLKQTGLDKQDFWLSKRDGLPFGDDQTLWDLVRDGEKLFAGRKAVVGRVLAA